MLLALTDFMSCQAILKQPVSSHDFHTLLNSPAIGGEYPIFSIERANTTEGK